MRVIKIGGRVQSDPALAIAIADAWRARASDGDVCVVHGGGDEVSRLQRLMGVEPQFVNGRRVTSAADMDVLRMGLSGASNKRIVAALQNLGADAVGISGEDGTLIGATRVADERLGQVGAPTTINSSLLQMLLHGGYLPVVSPMGRSLDDGSPLNINGDDAAAAIAAALAADELLLVLDVDGVRAGNGEAGGMGAIIPVLTAEDAEELVRSGSATGGMIAKLEAALLALRGGVTRVRIGGCESISNSSLGTTITLTPNLV